MLASACGNGALASSQFDANDEGWTSNGDADPVQIRAAGGNPGGHICATESNETGERWYFVAPQKFLGEKSAAYGLRLTWDMKQNARFVLDDSGRDVLIQGNGITLVFNLKALPGTDWTSTGARLDATANSGWRVDDGSTTNPRAFPLATEKDMRSVFKNVTSLRFRGEFYAGDDVGCLDNVFFGIE